MIRVGGEHIGEPGKDTEFCGLVYPDGDIITRHMAARLRSEPFYQHDKLMDALPRVRQRRVAIDCGAWVGGWSRELAKHFERVVAIEANPDNARCVKKNVPGNVLVIHSAVGDWTGRSPLFARGTGANVGTTVVNVPAGDPTFGVPISKLDDMVATLSAVDAVGIDFIKIHVNGMELKALRGARETIGRHRPVLTVVLKPAIADYGDSVEAARAFLTNDLGYRCAGGERPYEIWVPK